MSRGYRIADEPGGGRWTVWVVNPIWPLFAVMFAGAWLSWPWFVFNGVAVGSPTKAREIGLVVGGFVGSAVLLFLTLVVLNETVPGAQMTAYVPFGLLALTVWKLGISYWLYVMQARTFGVYEYYGGKVRNGLFVVIVGFMVAPGLIGGLPESLGMLTVLLR